MGALAACSLLKKGRKGTDSSVRLVVTALACTDLAGRFELFSSPFATNCKLSGHWEKQSQPNLCGPGMAAGSPAQLPGQSLQDRKERGCLDSRHCCRVPRSFQRRRTSGSTVCSGHGLEHPTEGCGHRGLSTGRAVLAVPHNTGLPQPPPPPSSHRQWIKGLREDKENPF